MKVTPIKQMGSFGVFVDDLNMDHMTEEEWMELGKLFIKELVVICRNITISKEQYSEWIPKFGALKTNFRSYLNKKYGDKVNATIPETWAIADEADRRWLESRKYQVEYMPNGRQLTRVYGRHDENGNMLGYFSSGEVYWHSNEASSLTFSPAVSLLGWENMAGSATGFVQTVDLYEGVSESFRSELNEMILVHKYEAGRLNDNEKTDEILALHAKMVFCPEDYVETPLVCTAPNGRRGLHYTVNTRAEIKGMTAEQSQKVFDELDKLVFDKKWIYDHYYTQDNDLLLFDNSITLHRRLGGHPERKAFRLQWDISPLLDKPWYPWQMHESYNQTYIEQTHELINLVGGDLKEKFKLP